MRLLHPRAGLLSGRHARRGPSHVSPDVAETRVDLTDAEVRERMSGNLCRCGAYVNIVAAIQDVARAAASDGGAA